WSEWTASPMDPRLWQPRGGHAERFSPRTMWGRGAPCVLSHRHHIGADGRDSEADVEARDLARTDRAPVPPRARRRLRAGASAVRAPRRPDLPSGRGAAGERERARAL